MNNLQKDFLQRSIAKLENLTESANREETLSPEFLRESFRALHTIKGTSQTFGFAASARLAHELENLLSGAKDDSNDFKNTLLEGFALLIQAFEQTDNSAAEEFFLDKLQKLVPNFSPPQNSFSPQIPPEISKKLSEYERNVFVSALRAGKNVFCIKADFDLTEFSVGFKNLRESLSLQGEIIATLPQAAEKNKIGFLIYFASDEKEIAQDFPAEIVRESASFSDDLDGVLSHVAAHGKELALEFDKQVEITVSADKIELSAEKLKLVFDVLLHLIRNAVDHAIEKAVERTAKGKEPKGTIGISLKNKRSNLELSVKDDGKGIDSEKIRAKAIEKNLISNDKMLTETEMLDLIFLHEFSTRETVSEISGRGVGLDAVKNLIETAGGKINVKSLKDSGTTFEIFLPYEL